LEIEYLKAAVQAAFFCIAWTLVILASGTKVGDISKNGFLWRASSRNNKQRILVNTSSGVGLSALSFASPPRLCLLAMAKGCRCYPSRKATALVFVYQ